MSDHDKLREAIAYMRQTIRILDGNLVASGAENIERWKVILDAAESALPRIKTVSYWIVEYANKPAGDWRYHADRHNSSAEAFSSASHLRSCDDVFCVNVTGPHLQEVPAT